MTKMRSTLNEDVCTLKTVIFLSSIRSKGLLDSSAGDVLKHL